MRGSEPRFREWRVPQVTQIVVKTFAVGACFGDRVSLDKRDARRGRTLDSAPLQS